MKSIRFVFALIAAVATVYFGYGYITSQTTYAWKSNEIMQPEELMKILHDTKSEKPTILNIGFSGNILDATTIGAASEADGMKNLKEKLSSVSKNKFIVFYCGCCPFEHCPNIRPAFKLLKDMGFTNFKLLNLPENLKTNWIDKGFPMAKN
jgi:thiosulfate/3-mercaptopyruvate sulfurtransferase